MMHREVLEWYCIFVSHINNMQGVRVRVLMADAASMKEGAQKAGKAYFEFLPTCHSWG
jgi:hypothetical protein